MRRFIWWLLFETTFGDRLLGIVEDRFGLAVVSVGFVDRSSDMASAAS